MFLNILVAFFALGAAVIFLAARKDSVVLKYLVKNHINCLFVYHIILSFYAGLLGSFGKKLREKSFGNLLTASGPIYGCAAEKYKTQLFAELKDEKKRLTILEIGIGTGGNFVYYPNECDLIVVEPNGEFRKLVDENLKKFEGIHLKNYYQISGESMNPIEDNSVDIVITTLVLCSVEDISKVMNEIRRVLKPGGKYYFLDHVSDHPFTFRWLIQSVISKTHLWPFVMLGCTFRDVRTEVKKAGFASVKDNVTNLVFYNFTLFLFLCAPHYFGVATK